MTNTILTQVGGTGCSPLTCWQCFWLVEGELKQCKILRAWQFRFLL